jgi:hypothetical protein
VPLHVVDGANVIDGRHLAFQWSPSWLPSGSGEPMPSKPPCSGRHIAQHHHAIDPGRIQTATRSNMGPGDGASPGPPAPCPGVEPEVPAGWAGGARARCAGTASGWTQGGVGGWSVARTDVPAMAVFPETRMTPSRSGPWTDVRVGSGPMGYRTRPIVRNVERLCANLARMQPEGGLGAFIETGAPQSVRSRTRVPAARQTVVERRWSSQGLCVSIAAVLPRVRP